MDLNAIIRECLLGERTDTVVCFTTNGFVKSTGEAVMGRGCAKVVNDIFPDLALKLGWYLDNVGNRVHTLRPLGERNNHLLSFPTKHRCSSDDQLLPFYRRQIRPGVTIYPGWMGASDPKLIQCSAEQLRETCRPEGPLHPQEIYLPAPGCSNGGLTWTNIEVMLDECFKDDNRYTIITEN